MTAPQLKKEMIKIQRMITRIKRICDTCAPSIIYINDHKITVKGMCNRIWISTGDLEENVNWFLKMLEKTDPPIPPPPGNP